jgi:hypothetical protein
MHIGKNAKFEQDRNYEDMDGNLKSFTIRDYSKKTKIGTNKFKGNVKQEYIDSIYAIVDELIDEVPAKFAKEIETVVEKDGNEYIWNRENLYLMHMDDNRYHVLSDLSRLKKEIYENIKEYIFCTDADCRDKVQIWKDSYKLDKFII